NLEVPNTFNKVIDPKKIPDNIKKIKDWISLFLMRFESCKLLWKLNFNKYKTNMYF
mgnify:CR=1